MGGKTISNSETRLEAVKLQSSTFGAVIALVYGVTRIAGNLVWYGGFKAVPHTDTQGGKGGVKVQSTTYSYTANVIMGLCHGPVSSIPRAWRGKKMYSGGITPSQLVLAVETAPAGAVGRVYTVANAATFAAVVEILNTDFPGIPLVEGEDFTRAGGAFTVLFAGAITIAYQYVTGGVFNNGLAQLGLTFKTGEIGQPMWSALSAFPGEDIAYSGLAYVAGQDYDLGTGAQVELHTFELIGPMAYHLGSTVPDVDTSLVTRDVLTNTRAGAGFPSSSLGNWAAWSDFCVASGLLVSPAITEQSSAADVLMLAAKLTNTGPVWSEAKLKMVPYADTAVTGNGRTFTPNTTPVYLLDDDCWADAPLRSERKSRAERYNHVRVEYLDRSGQYNPAIAEAEDLADIDVNGRRTMPTVKAYWLCTADAARLVAQMLMQRSLYVERTYTGPLPWHFALLEPMDLVQLTDLELELAALPARVTVVEETESGDLVMTAEDYPAGVSSAALYTAQRPLGYQPDYNAAPGNADTPVIFESPADQTGTGLEVCVAVRGSGTAWGGAQVWVSVDGTNYRQVGVVFGGARFGTLSAAVAAGAASMGVQGLGSAQIISGSASDAAALTTLCYVGGASPEYLAYTTATLTGAGAYTLGGLVRGAYGTANAAHAAGSAFVRVDDRVARSGDLGVDMVGKTLYVKVCSFNIWGGGQQGLADVAATTYVITGAMVSIPPDDVSGLSAGGGAAQARIYWNASTSKRYKWTELRLGTSWAAGTLLATAAGSSYPWTTAAPGAYTVWARHVDQFGNYSANAVSAGFTVAAAGSGGGGNVTFLQPAAPAGGALGDIWIESDNGNAEYRFDGTTWQPVLKGTAAIEPRAITVSVIEDTSTTTGSIGAPGSSVTASFFQGSGVAYEAGDEVEIVCSGQHAQQFFSQPATAVVDIRLYWDTTFGGQANEITVAGTSRRRFTIPVVNATNGLEVDLALGPMTWTPGAGTKYLRLVYTISYFSSSGAAVQCGRSFSAQGQWRLVRRKR